MTRRTSPGAGVVFEERGCEKLPAGLVSIANGLRHDQRVDVPSVEFTLNVVVPPAVVPGGGMIWLKLFVILLVQNERYAGPFDPAQVVAQTTFAEWELTAANAGTTVGAMKPRTSEIATTAAV
jgi:hypothetical protein